MRSTPKKSSAERRQQIAEAVIEIIGEVGFNSLTTTALATKIGLTSGALFRHFSSQEEILVHATSHAVQCIEGSYPDASLPALDRLRCFAKNRVQALGPNPGLAWFVRSEQALLSLPEEAGESLKALAARSRKFLIKAITDGIKDGSIRKDVKPEHLLVIVTGTMHVLIGMSGLQSLTVGKTSKADAVLSSLLQLIAPAGIKK